MFVNTSFHEKEMNQRPETIFEKLKLFGYVFCRLNQ